jgi:hypothetical protein
MLKLIGLLLSVIMGNAQGAEICSRIATVNYQDVLVDVSSQKRGEGLRYYLQKDPIAKDLLDQYQENNRTTWKSAASSTLGTAMILGGFLRSSNSGENESFTSQNFLMIGGATLIAVSYLISKTNQFNNEYLLTRSVDEYNKRNTPRIFFAPTGNPKSGMGMGLGIGKEF